jgi:hypothetical protein
MAGELTAAILARWLVEADQVPKGLKILRINGKMPGDKDPARDRRRATSSE